MVKGPFLPLCVVLIRTLLSPCFCVIRLPGYPRLTLPVRFRPLSVLSIIRLSMVVRLEHPVGPMYGCRITESNRPLVAELYPRLCWLCFVARVWVVSFALRGVFRPFVLSRLLPADLAMLITANRVLTVVVILPPNRRTM